MWAQWLLLILYVSVGVTNIARGALGFVVGPAIAVEAPTLLWFSAIHAGWGVVFLGVSAARLVKPETFTRRPVASVAVLYQATMWVIKMMGERASYARSLWPRDLILTAAFIGVVLILTRIAVAQTPVRARR